MLKCWSYNAQERPNFTYILGQLNSFADRCTDPTSQFAGVAGKLSVHIKVVSSVLHGVRFG